MGQEFAGELYDRFCTNCTKQLLVEGKIWDHFYPSRISRFLSSTSKCRNYRIEMQHKALNFDPILHLLIRRESLAC